MMDKIIDLCYKICNAEDKDNWMHNGDFVLHTVNDGEDFVQIDSLNRSHTAMFKIRAKKRDLGLTFKYPCIYDKVAASLRKLELRKVDMTSLPDRSYIDLLKFDDVFDIEYDSVEYSDLSRLLNIDECSQIDIRNNGFHAVYSKYLINSVLIDDDLEDIGLKILHPNAPLRLHYQYGVFNIYCLIAPRVEVIENMFFLRV